MPLVEPDLAGMQGVEPMLELLEFPLRAARPLPGVGQAALQPLDLLRGGA
jgi:hypothetical protein